AGYGGRRQCMYGYAKRQRSLLPVGDVLVGTFTAFLAVGPQGDEVVRAVLPWCGVLVFIPPWIRRHLRLLPIRAVPVGDARRRGDQRLQSLLRRRIAADLELEEIERLADLPDLDLRGVRLGLFAATDEVAADDAEHDTDQD